jgi:HsdM N-terminal domain
MSLQSSTIVQRVWNYCNVLRDDGISYGDYLEQLTCLLFLKMDDEGCAARADSSGELGRRAGLSSAGGRWDQPLAQFSIRRFSMRS